MRSDSVRLVSTTFPSLVDIHRNIHDAVTVQAELLRAASPRATPVMAGARSPTAKASPRPRTVVYFGTYTRVLHHSRGTGKGVFGFRLDNDTGYLAPLKTDSPEEADESGLVVRADGLLCPAYFCRDRGPSGEYLWAVNETSKFDYARPDIFGSVTLFRWLRREGGLLERLGEFATAGHGACHPWTDHLGRFLLIANYWSGSVVVFHIEREAVESEHTTSPRLHMVQHVQFISPVDAVDEETKPCAASLLGLTEAMQQAQKAKSSLLGFRRDRQDGPHSHQIVVDPTERFLYVPDLGTDRIYQFILRFDEVASELAYGKDQESLRCVPHAALSGSDAQLCTEAQDAVAAHVRGTSPGPGEQNGRPIQAQQQRFITPAGVVSDYPFQAPQGGVLYQTEFARATGTVCCLLPHPSAAFVSVPPSGAGPRHMLLHPSGRWALVLCELNATLLCYAWDGPTPVETVLGHQTASGLLSSKPASMLDLLPAYYRQRYSPETLHQYNISSALRLHPLRTDRLYASNRGHDSVAVIEFSEQTGCMRILQWVPSGGRTPRDIALDPRAEFLYVANQDSDRVAVFKLDPDTGLVLSTGHHAPCHEQAADAGQSADLGAAPNPEQDGMSADSMDDLTLAGCEQRCTPYQTLSIREPCTVFVEEVPL